MREPRLKTNQDILGSCMEDLKKKIKLEQNHFHSFVFKRDCNNLTRCSQHLVEKFENTRMNVVLYDRVFLRKAPLYCKHEKPCHPLFEVTVSYYLAEEKPVFVYEKTECLKIQYICGRIKNSKPSAPQTDDRDPRKILPSVCFFVCVFNFFQFLTQQLELGD